MEGERAAGIEIDLLGGIQLFLTLPSIAKKNSHRSAAGIRDQCQHPPWTRERFFLACTEQRLLRKSERLDRESPLSPQSPKGRVFLLLPPFSFPPSARVAKVGLGKVRVTDDIVGRMSGLVISKLLVIFSFCTRVLSQHSFLSFSVGFRQKVRSCPCVGRQAVMAKHQSEPFIGESPPFSARATRAGVTVEELPQGSPPPQPLLAAADGRRRTNFFSLLGHKSRYVVAPPLFSVQRRKKDNHFFSLPVPPSFPSRDFSRL